MSKIFLLLLNMILIPQLVIAQIFAGFKSGSYSLKKTPNIQQSSLIKYVDYSKIMSKDVSGEKLQLLPLTVASVRIGKHYYLAVKNVRFPFGFGVKEIENAFAERLDSGQVELVHFDYTTTYMTTGGLNGTGAVGGSTYIIYMIRSSPADDFVVIPHNDFGDGGQKFRDFILPFFVNRVDLALLVETKRATNQDIPSLIRALNTGEPYIDLRTMGH